MVSLIAALSFMIIFDVMLFCMYQNIAEPLKRTEKNCTIPVMAYCCDMDHKVTGTKYRKHTAYPIFRYRVGNEEIISRYKFGMLEGVNYPQKYQVGMEVLIKYDPRNPYDIYIPDNMDPYKEAKTYLWGIAIITAGSIFFGLIGMVLEFMGLLII